MGIGCFGLPQIFLSTFFAMHDALKITAGDTTTPFLSLPEILMAMAKGYQTASELLTPLIGEVERVLQAEPNPTLNAIQGDLKVMQSLLLSMAEMFGKGIESLRNYGGAAAAKRRSTRRLTNPTTRRKMRLYQLREWR